jgi:hypothetical protein
LTLGERDGVTVFAVLVARRLHQGPERKIFRLVGHVDFATATLVK